MSEAGVHTETKAAPRRDDRPALRRDETLFASANRFVNREISWLEFNRRVLEESENEGHPLLERLRFLSISGSNLDEFFMVRVAGLKGQERENISTLSDDGLTPGEQLRKIDSKVTELVAEQQAQWAILQLALADTGIVMVSPDQLEQGDLARLENHFMDAIFPVLTPLAIDPAHPFPFIPNLGFTIALELSGSKQKAMNALIRVPNTLDRFIRLPGKDEDRPIRFISLEDTTSLFIKKLFPGYEISGRGAFRVIRDSDIEIEEEAEDLVRLFERALKRRRRGSVIRLELEEMMPAPLRKVVQDALGAADDEMHIIPGMLGIKDLAQLVEVDRPDLKFEPYAPRIPNAYASMAATVSRLSGKRTLSFTTPMNRSTWSWRFCARRRAIPMSWRSSKRCTGPRTTRRSSRR